METEFPFYYLAQKQPVKVGKEKRFRYLILSRSNGKIGRGEFIRQIVYSWQKNFTILRARDLLEVHLFLTEDEIGELSTDSKFLCVVPTEWRGIKEYA